MPLGMWIKGVAGEERVDHVMVLSTCRWAPVSTVVGWLCVKRLDTSLRGENVEKVGSEAESTQ